MKREDSKEKLVVLGVGVDVPVIAPQNKELTYIAGETNINLTLFADITGERLPDTGFDTLCSSHNAYSRRSC